MGQKIKKAHLKFAIDEIIIINPNCLKAHIAIMFFF